MDPKLNQQAIAEGNARINALDVIIADPSASPAAKRDATAARKGLQQEVSLRRKVEGAKTPAAKKKAEQSLAAFRAKNCPTAEDGRTIAKCRPTPLFVHLHMRFLLPPALLCDMRDVSKYPRRAANVSEATFKSRFSFAGQTIPAKKRWSGDHPVVGATVTLDGKEASTDKLGIARFENVGAGTYTLKIEPPANQSTTLPAGPELPVATGYKYEDAPMYLYRPFQVTVTVDDQGRWRQQPEAAVALSYRGTSAAYASVAGSTAMDLYLDWKPDWLKIPNRHVQEGRTNQAVVMHQTATTGHEQIGSPIDTFHGGEGTAAHYLVDLDGHVVKLVHESEVTAHAAASHWHELDGLNNSGIGIETVHTDDVLGQATFYREFPDEQYEGINRLVTSLRDTFKITKRYVCGHNDCRDGARVCPGDMFDWKKLEDAGNALSVHDGGSFEGDRVVEPDNETDADETVPMAQRLYEIGYTEKTVRTALSRFLVRAWSGSRFDARPTGTGIEPVPPPPEPPAPAVRGKPHAKPHGRPRTVWRVTQRVADALEQMFCDL